MATISASASSGPKPVPRAATTNPVQTSEQVIVKSVQKTQGLGRNRSDRLRRDRINTSSGWVCTGGAESTRRATLLSLWFHLRLNEYGVQTLSLAVHCATRSTGQSAASLLEDDETNQEQVSAEKNGQVRGVLRHEERRLQFRERG